MKSFDWTRNARIIGIDGYQPPLYPDRDYNAEAIVELAKEVDANVIRISMMGKLAHFNTNMWDVDQYMKSHDFLQEIIDLAHPLGIRVVPYVPGAHNLPFELLMKWHPEWIQRAYPYQPLEETLTKPHSGSITGFICPIGPYREFYTSMVTEVILNHDVDGWYTDGWKDCYLRPVCYCASCCELFKDDTGEDLYNPYFVPGGSRSNEVVSWYYNRLVAMVQEIHAIVKSKKSIPTMINGISGVLGYQSQGEWGKDIDTIHDVVHFERKTEPYDRLVSASYLNVRGEKAWIYAGLYSPLQFEGPDRAEENYADEHLFPYRKELFNECFIAYACGQGVNNMRANSLLLDMQSPGKAILKDIYSTVKDNPVVFEGGNYFPFVGVLNQEIERWKYEGPWLRTLVKQGIQATIFKKEDIADRDFLKKFYVLISESIGEGLQKKIIEYVKCGGRWITTDDVFSLAWPNAAVLDAPEDMKAFACGRGLVLQISQKITPERLLDAVRFITGGYLPYKVGISSGELIPVLSVKPGQWAIHLINISTHFTGLFDQGLEKIPAIENVSIEINLPEGVSFESAYMLRSSNRPKLNIQGNIITAEIKVLNEYDAFVIKFKILNTAE